ncbi:glycoside hydrolase family 3 N-terminal domain-containing protein [Enterocloster aldenensis]|uniref:glycoside hydrolase family 3 N-terminal domain-containing protein n=1 Tax=Enterocloster aldenensis TaxID=358742 RepID=UPI004029FE00
MGKYPVKGMEFRKIVLDESGLLDDSELRESTIFGEQHLPGTTTLIKEWFSRHLILRENPSPDDLADWINQLHCTAEECGHFIPVQVASNSRNENGETVFGMNDASGTFATWPGTLGIAAAVRGGGIEIIDRFSDCIRRVWDSTGLKKGYMYMADCVTDPRWQRTFGTFGEDPALTEAIFEHLIPGIQGSKEGVTANGISMTVKHFPGGGARENGFDPHYETGQWNVYATPGSLKAYHLPPFRPAVKYHAASIMPYYSKPATAKSAPQKDLMGNPIKLVPYGFAYNKVFIHDILREQMGFDGYINSDTGITHNMSWGVEMLDLPERIGFAITHAGVDLISGLFDNDAGVEAYQRAYNDYYETHPVPEGFSSEELVLTDESLNRAVAKTLTDLFRLGMFENPYRNPQKALEMARNPTDWKEAEDIHRKSVVLLKNSEVLPLTEEKTEGAKIYAEAFRKTPEGSAEATTALRDMMKNLNLVSTPEEADYAILMATPSSGDYFNATEGYLELDICEEKTVPNVDADGRPTASSHLETTLSGIRRIPQIAEAVHANGGKVIASLNISLAWEPGNLEPYCDAFLAGFDTFPRAVIDIIFGKASPCAKLPLTLPRGDEVLAVDAEGRCISPNDVPGYDKDHYIDQTLKDENGKAYAYRDSTGNYYELDFGLIY